MYMKHKLSAILLCLTISDLSLAQSREQQVMAQAPRSVQNTGGLPASKVEKIEPLILAWMEQHKAPALSVAIATDNQLRWSKGYGVIDLENSVPANADTAYRLASISKSITATAV